MFSIRIPHQDQSATVKLSSARVNAQMKGRTKGLAFKYVQQGCEIYQLDGETITLRAGEFMLLPAERFFAAGARPKKEIVTGVCVDFSSTNSLLAASTSQGTLAFGLPLPFRELSKTQKATSTNAGAFAQNELSRLLEYLQDDLSQLLPQMLRQELILKQQIKKHGTRQHLIRGLLTGKNYLQDNYNKRVTLHDLAKVSGISSYRMQRLFSAVFGQSPQQFQRDIRMIQAKKMLADQERSLSEIAFLLGYSDLAAFSNQFYQHFQCRPSKML